MITLARNWWAFVLRGVVAILFGLLTFIMPGMALLTLVYMFGFYAIADGVFNIIAAFRRTAAPTQPPWWALLISGVFSVIAGIIAFVMPGITALALLFLIAGWAVVTGVLSIVAAVRLRKQITGEWMLILSGVLSVLFGVMVAIFPGPGALAVVLWIGAYAVVSGSLMVALGIRLRSWARRAVGEAGQGFPAVAPGH